MHHFVMALPSPANGVWQLGPFPVRAYAISILIGIAVAIRLGNKRWVERGGVQDQVLDIAMWAVPFGVIGGRIYHVLTDWPAYFSENGKGFLAALKIWEGGLGIWGAIALGGVGVYIASKRMAISFLPLADALAPGIVAAQAIGRWGNWFNQELFGRPTTLPWGLRIDAIHRPVGFEEFETFHPTFLYESIACTVIAVILIKADKKFVLGYGRVFALYVALYCAARGVIETLRIDQASVFLGIRLNVFTSLVVGLAALIYFVLSAERYPGRETLEDGLVPAVRARLERQQRKLEMTGAIPVTAASAVSPIDTPKPEAAISERPQSRAERRAARSADSTKQTPEVVEVVEVPKPAAMDIGLTQAIERAIIDTTYEPTPDPNDSGKERGRRRKR
jgi:prolipoprotein diacylglyceryl transferase